MAGGKSTPEKIEVPISVTEQHVIEMDEETRGAHKRFRKTLEQEALERAERLRLKRIELSQP